MLGGLTLHATAGCLFILVLLADLVGLVVLLRRRGRLDLSPASFTLPAIYAGGGALSVAGAAFLRTAP